MDFLFRRWPQNFTSCKGATETRKNVIPHSSQADKLYLIQEAQYAGGSSIAVNDGDNHYREGLAFMINVLKDTVPTNLYNFECKSLIVDLNIDLQDNHLDTGK